MAMLICAGTVALGLLNPGRAAAEDLNVSARFVQTGGNQAELHIAWRWVPPQNRRMTATRRSLVAVSFDTRRLVFDSDRTTGLHGADGALLEQLDRAVGIDGARRLYEIEPGEDGEAVLRFRSVWPDMDTAGSTVRIHVLIAEPGEPARLRELGLPAL